MTTCSYQVTVQEVTVQVIKKKIKHAHLRIYPPDGRVVVSAPQRLADKHIRQFITDKLTWITAKQAAIQQLSTTAELQCVTGESHLFLGKAYPLHVIEQTGRPGVTLNEAGQLSVLVKLHASSEARQRVLDRWYRDQLAAILQSFVHKWEPIMQVQVQECRIKKMTTRWGTCNSRARRIWLSLELIKQPLACIEYVVVHEMVHFFESSHNHRFKALMDQFLPDWRQRKAQLNQR